MNKTYCIRENRVIINPNTVNERDLTEEKTECRYCKYDKKTCKGNKESCFCDWFTMKEGYTEIEEQ